MSLDGITTDDVSVLFRGVGHVSLEVAFDLKVGGRFKTQIKLTDGDR